MASHQHPSTTRLSSTSPALKSVGTEELPFTMFAVVQFEANYFTRNNLSRESWAVQHDQQRYRIRSHDLYGPLPTIEIEDNGDRPKVVSAIRNDAAKLSAIHGFRRELLKMLEDGTFLEPTLVDETVVVGISYGNGDFTTMAEGTSFLDAYHKLREKVIDEIFPT